MEFQKGPPAYLFTLVFIPEYFWPEITVAAVIFGQIGLFRGSLIDKEATNLPIPLHLCRRTATVPE